MYSLKKYLTDNCESVAEFAARVGASRQTLYRVINGRQTPKPGLARRIVQATGGVVKLSDLQHNTGAAAVIPFDALAAGDRIDERRLKAAFSIVVNHLNATSAQDLPTEIIDIAVEAAINTYAALAPVTSRLGPDRLTQALRPVLGEILQEMSAAPVTAYALDQGAQLAAELYFQAMRLGARK